MVKKLYIKDKAKFELYKKQKQKYIKILETIAYIGQNGTTLNKKEGDKKTPEGIFNLGIALGTKNTINNNKINYRKINKNLYWIDDIESNYYNQLVNVKNIKKDWKSAEHLIEYPEEYKYAIEIKSNPTNEKGKGSAIFLHCSKNKPTAGCVAIECSKMQEVINQIDNNTIIIIFGNKNN